MTSMPSIGSRVRYYRPSTQSRNARSCEGVVVGHYVGGEKCRDDAGDWYIIPDAAAVKVDSPLPSWWPYAGSNVFVPDISELAPI